MVISVMAPPRFSSPLWRTRVVPGRWTHHTRPGGPGLLSEPHTRAAVSRASMRCPVGAWIPRGPTLPAGDTVSARAAYARADRLDTGRLAHPRALRMSSCPRPFLGYRVGGHAPAARGTGRVSPAAR